MTSVQPKASTSSHVGNSSSSSSSSTIALTPDVMVSLKPSKVFRKHIEVDKQYTSLSFDDKGEFLVTAAEDETMQIFNVRTGKHKNQHYSKKYGVHLARFTHKNTNVIHASTKGSDDIRYLSLHDNNYIRYFKGHTKKVVSLEMSPVEDHFISGATDDTVQLWDLRAQKAQGKLHIAGHPCVAFDPTGVIFVVALNLRSTLLFFDKRDYDKQPFLHVNLDDQELSKISFPPRVPIYTSIKFSNDGNKLLVGTSGDVHYVLDAFTGSTLARLETGDKSGLERASVAPFERPLGDPVAGLSSEEVSWTPDGRFVLAGSIDGKIYIWDASHIKPSSSDVEDADQETVTLQPLHADEGHLDGPSRCLLWNNRAAMFASAGDDLAFWLPDLEGRKAGAKGTEDVEMK
ncbi:hypothetical protein MVLG_02443 [Microbotryum lychnidis-dioicae p1A1 Lamole]|uniref:Anaphase-promoting complex subunit 4 WD40 domain-containing protein n=1 Tax=Microbotryum lychnidis-dioicae (strain p1A1 Lamole / MvSl-1064) TaxID=683840 RepID=U5H565_USTV1|nr:hypothetical protein MVLG_02443 [Microbotryum lychnidis-dioicae p1A1 Lamole]|eukprot:KDE07220.1 hypothetical protein MVLG_02443 [Microbotryum lychnidis-dioicae p1A1 Lamole]